MKRTDDLPPKPDSQTGEPRPPIAPLVAGAGRDAHEVTRGVYSKRRPTPPKGRGPALEWFQGTRWFGISAFLLGFIYIVIAGTIQEWSFWWMSVWWIWLAPVGLGINHYFRFRRQTKAAGADWYADGRHWVDAYDLKSVRVKDESGRLDLDLTDRSGRSVSTTCMAIEKNRKLWDLVYNGIIHSAKEHPLETNEDARQYLDLPL